jgi:hypothetical protein
VANCLRWGVLPPGFDICEHHFGLILEEIRKVAPGLSRDYQEDYARIYLLMESPYTFLRCLGLLNAVAARKIEDARLDGHAPDPVYLRLSKMLQLFEDRCWFQPDLLVPVGLLDGDDFLTLVRLGYHLKDYGAGVKHGEFTHRLQWHVIMRVITADFTNPNPNSRHWNHTPLDLYTRLGTKEGEGLWGYLLDNPGDGTKRSMRHPDWVHQTVLKETGLSVIGGMIARREKKRREEFVALMKDYLAAYPDQFLHPKSKAKVAKPLYQTNVNSHEFYKQYEREYLTALGTTQSDKNLETIYYSFADAASTAYRAKKEKPGTKRDKPRPAYLEVVKGVFKLTPGALAKDEDARARVAASYTGFQGQH